MRKKNQRIVGITLGLGLFAVSAAVSSSLDPIRQGYTYAITNSYTTNATNYLIAQSITLSSDATVTGFGVNWAFGYCTTCTYAMYTDSSGPDALEGELTSMSCGTNEAGNNEVSGVSFAVTAGTHWITANFSGCSLGANLYVADSGGTGVTTYYGIHTAGDSAPDPFGFSATVNSRDYGIYPIGETTPVELESFSIE